MSLIRLAWLNFSHSFKNYLSLILSLAFTVLIYFNFQNMITSASFSGLGAQSMEKIEIVIQAITVVLLFFVFSFLWYSTNTFLQYQKKEMGTYIFMGLSSQRIGSLYVLETLLIGLSAILLGLAAGVLFSKFFLLIIGFLSGIEVNTGFHVDFGAVINTFLVFMLIYSLFVFKGYISIVKSSIIELMNAQKANEYVKQNKFFLIFKALLGTGITGYGYYLAIKDAGMDIFGNLLGSVVCIIVGIYLIFGGLLPLLFQVLASRKKFLYQKERVLWINSVIYRMKRNYRTYAVVCILMICSITALATGFIMKKRTDNVLSFKNQYSYQLVTPGPDALQQADSIISKSSAIKGEIQLPMLVDTSGEKGVGIISYSSWKQTAETMDLPFDYPSPSSDQIYLLKNLPLMDFSGESVKNMTLFDKTYSIKETVGTAYYGLMQDQSEIAVVSDKIYNGIKEGKDMVYLSCIELENPKDYIYSKEEMQKEFDGYLFISDPEMKNDEWLKTLFALASFMFLVFILAACSILFMKQSNEAYEERERFKVLKKIGISNSDIKKAVRKELAVPYGLAYIGMLISSYFSLTVISKVTSENTFFLGLVCSLIILGMMIVFYLLSVSSYYKNADI